MRVVFLAGGIASGKSTVRDELSRLGASCVDLDALSREATTQGSPALTELAQEFGSDVLDKNGELRRSVLASRAFASPEATHRLEDITHPRIRELLEEWLGRHAQDAMCVVEVPLLDRVEDLLPLADDVVCVLCDMSTRRERAISRGMSGEDFDARVRRQPTDAYLVAHATTTFVNDGDKQALLAQIDHWWEGLQQDSSSQGFSHEECEVCDEH